MSIKLPWINYLGSSENQKYFRDYKGELNNLITLACKHNEVKLLEYLFFSNSETISSNKAGCPRESTIPQISNDEAGHNAFYYAIRSGNVQLLETLINKWPGNYFSSHVDELDEILSQAYEELKLKGVCLTEEMEIFVENALINIRFFSDNSVQDFRLQDHLNNIRERINLVLQNISLLKEEFSKSKEIDQKCLFIAKFIAQNIHILKRQWKSSYVHLPWEEMEFCLITFVSSYLKRQEINLFYNAILGKYKIMHHLEHFANKLEELKGSLADVDMDKIANLPLLKRQKVVDGIVDSNPEFNDLYSHYQQIRDIHSLEKINSYLKLSLSTDPKEKEGQLILARSLQVIGEFLKNTLESPKMSTTTSELLLLSLPQNTRHVIIDLRNSLSHAYSLFKRTEIEKNTDLNFFIGVQHDIAEIKKVISDILVKNKIKMIKTLLNQIIKSETPDDINEVVSIMRNVSVHNILPEVVKHVEDDQLKTLIKELKNTVTGQTDYEQMLFNDIDRIINLSQSKENSIQEDYAYSFASLMALCSSNFRVDDNVFRGIKFFANSTLKNMHSKIDGHDSTEIARIAIKIAQSAKHRIHDGNLGRLVYNIVYIFHLGTGDLKWIEKLRRMFNEKGSFFPVPKQKKTYNALTEKYLEQLEEKITQLKLIFRNNISSERFIESVLSYKRDEKLQAVVEMLVLDVMSILDYSKKILENNLLFLDESTPTLTGKCLRNHIAHDNTLFDILVSDSLIAVILNAKRLISENIIKCNNKIGKLCSDDLSKLKVKYNQSLAVLDNQRSLFAALQKGNLKDVRSFLKLGGEIHARSINLSTILHFAACGPSLKIIKYIVDQKLDVNIKDVNGQSPLHIAAAHGNHNMVDYFLKEAGMYVDVVDNSGKTPLHIAAKNGHKDTIKCLLKNNASSNMKDMIGFSPLHLAMQYGHVDAVKILLEKEEHVDFNEALAGSTLLHVAAEFGHLELVNYLITKGVNVNARNDKQVTPLHLASLNGHLEIVKIMINNGADVNSNVMDGCTPLHYAIENGHAMIAKILLKHGANVNAADKTYKNTPLHYATKDGYEDIVEDLLIYKANVNVTTVEGITPLHFAVQGGHLSIVTNLLNHGANVFARDMYNSTPLYYAAKYGGEKITELLLHREAVINDKAINNVTPLHIAALNGHKDVVQLLIKNKADVRACDMKGRTPLHAAAENGMIDIIETLIENKGDVDVRTNEGMTPLHIAALSGNQDAVALLISSKAKVNITDGSGFTPLHVAVDAGHKNIVNHLIENHAKVNIEDMEGISPLCLAVERGCKDIVKILLANGAMVNIKSKNKSPLLIAVKHNHKEIFKLLIEHGASIKDQNDVLLIAALLGNKHIVGILLNNQADVDIKDANNATPLHYAAKCGNKDILNALIARGANVEAMNRDGATPLCIAAQEGHSDVVEVLVANGANVNIVCVDGSPIHVAAAFGHVNVVEVLLRSGVKVNVKDNKGRTALELAVARGQMEVVKKLLQNKTLDLDAKGNDDWTILHIASQSSKLEMVKCLVTGGCNINAKNASGSKPIHIAAREGFKDTVRFFLSKGLSVNEYGSCNQTLLHYAAMKDRLDVVDYLIAQGADINARDMNGITPLHIAALCGNYSILEVLLKSGAIYNVAAKDDSTPLDHATNKDIINLLSSTEALFQSLKHNSCIEVERYIRMGASVNAKNVDSGTLLHYAASKGFDRVVNILLQNKANPKEVDSNGYTPLHHAAMSSHMKIVQALLSHGAVFDAVSEGGKTPLDFSKNRDITNLFKLIKESFKKVKDGNVQVINDLNKIKDINIVKAVMGASNCRNQTLVVAAIHNNFSNVKHLKQIFQSDMSMQIDNGIELLNRGNYQKALNIFTRALEKRKDVLGPDNPGTLDIQKHIATVMYKQGKYYEALKMYEEIFQKQVKVLGLKNEDTLNTRSGIALVLHRQGKDEAALSIFKEVHKIQKKLLGLNHTETLNNLFHMALSLNNLGKFEEALNINRDVFQNRKEILGAFNLATVIAQNNIALVLTNQGKYEESLKIYNEVFDKKKMILGINNADTLRTLHNIAGVLHKQNKTNEALKTFQDVLTIQKQYLPLNHPDTLHTQLNMGNFFFQQGKYISALKAYSECSDPIEIVLGPNNPGTLQIKRNMELMNKLFKLQGNNASDFLQYLQKDITIAASKGDMQTVQRLLNDGADANDKDIDGRTSLHYAISNGHVNIVKILLKHGADVTQATNKGNTSLHTAASKGYSGLIELLLQHTTRDKLHDFVNAKTSSGSTTALHVVATAGNIDIVLLLLKHGATYNIENKDGKTPLDLCNGHKVATFLKSLGRLFDEVKIGDIEAINKLSKVTPTELVCITNARNIQGNTLLQVAVTNKHKDIASKILKLLKDRTQK